jgi:hypothetical protein
MTVKSDDIEIDLLETTELVFSIRVEGASVKPRTRMIIQAEDVSYCFEGVSTNSGNVSFVVPHGIISEGTYKSSIEVLIGNKVLVPMTFNSVMKEKIQSKTNLVETKQLDDNVSVNVDVTKNTKRVLSRAPSLKDRYNIRKTR